MGVAVTLRFSYPWTGDETDENEIIDCLSELSPEELLKDAKTTGKPINVDVEVY